MRTRSSSWILYSGFCILFLAVAAGCEKSEPAYDQQILASRAEKDEAFKTSRESPLTPEQRASFGALSYFPPDESYRVAAALRVSEKDQQVIVTMPTSTGKLRDMRRVGSIEFNLKGQPLSLVAFTDAGDNAVRRLFVPFGDLTNGTESYPAGRYLDLDPTRTGLYDLDFNKAYNPYCAYNETYDCPYPPKENRLKIAVRAGEKMFSVVAGAQGSGTR